LSLSLFLYTTRHPPRHPLFPYTTLFRSLRPGIAAIVIAAHFPITRRVFRQEFDGLQPFRALPEIKMRDHQPDWPAVFRCEWRARSEEHTSELQSLTNLVCRLLLEKKTIH